MATVLFIEDEPALQKTLGDFLTSQGYGFRSAPNGPEGLAAIERERPDLVLLDLILPGMHGLDVLKRIRADPNTKSMPVVVLTNVESSESIGEALELGARAYLVKTNYTLEEVLEKVKSVLGERE